MKLKLALLLLTLTIVMVCPSCTPGTLAPSDYVHWVEDESNGLRVIKRLGDFDFTAQYKPVDYIIAQEEKSNQIPRDVYQKRKSELEGYVYFNLFIRSSDGKTPVLQNGTTPEGYYNRINYFVSNASNGFWIRSGQDTLDCALCHLEQNYGLAPENAIVLVFKPRRTITEWKDDMVLVYDDEVFGVGQVRMKIKASAWKDLPAMQVE